MCFYTISVLHIISKTLKVPYLIVLCNVINLNFVKAMVTYQNCHVYDFNQIIHCSVF